MFGLIIVQTATYELPIKETAIFGRTTVLRLQSVNKTWFPKDFHCAVHCTKMILATSPKPVSWGYRLFWHKHSQALEGCKGCTQLT